MDRRSSSGQKTFTQIHRGSFGSVTSLSKIHHNQNDISKYVLEYDNSSISSKDIEQRNHDNSNGKTDQPFTDRGFRKKGLVTSWKLSLRKHLSFRKLNNDEATKNNNNQSSKRRQSIKDTLSRVFSSGNVKEDKDTRDLSNSGKRRKSTKGTSSDIIIFSSERQEKEGDTTQTDTPSTSRKRRKSSRRKSSIREVVAGALPLVISPGRRRTLPELIEGLESEQGQPGGKVEIQNLPKKMDKVEEAIFNSYLSHRRCQKNPGHPTFIPLSDIKKSILPPEARHDVIVKIIKDTGLRSVKLTVYYTTDRPTRFNVGLPPHSKNGRLGTGWVELFDQTMDKLPGYKPGQTFVISTAAHVIFDKKEAKKTKVEFFYDDDGDTSGVVTAWGVSLILVNSSLDVCRFLCKAQSKEDGNRIIERFTAVPKVYPPMPPLKNIAWCVSHPHGFSKRVTLGKITSVIEDEPSWSCNMLKLLVFRCCIEKNIAERKVFYMFFKDSANGIGLFVPDGLSEIAKLEQKQQYLIHLVEKGVIERPTEKETTQIKNEYFQLLHTIVNERDALRDERYRLRILTPAKLEELNHLLFKSIVKDMALQTPTFKHFQEMFDGVEKELWSKKHELLFGTNSQHGDLARTKSIVYDLDSCPGSSGARITAYLHTMMGCRRFMGFHSRGLKGCQGNMCGGGGSRIVPTLPIKPPSQPPLQPAPPATRKQIPVVYESPRSSKKESSQSISLVEIQPSVAQSRVGIQTNVAQSRLASISMIRSEHKHIVTHVNKDRLLLHSTSSTSV